MRQIHSIVTSHQVTARVANELVRCLELRDFGTRVTAAGLARLWVLAAAARGSLSAVCKTHRRVASDETVRQATLEQVRVDQTTLEERLHAGLVAWAPRDLRRQPRPLAIDLTLLPFYGDERTPGIYRAQAKLGTKKFWAYATCVVLHRGQRVTLGVVALAVKGQLQEALARLLMQAKAAGVEPSYLTLDREFYSAKVIDWLQRHHIPFILPMVRRGRKAGDPRGPTGTQNFFATSQGGWADYTWTARKSTGPTVTVRVAIVPRSRRAPLVYVVHGLKPTSLTWIRNAYRRRFGIESSYRQMHQALARTTSVDPRWRLLLVGIALLLRNVWVWMHWAKISIPRRGARQLRLDQFSLAMLLQWLHQAILSERPLKDALRIPRPYAPIT